jgi:hypothetical protein
MKNADIAIALNRTERSVAQRYLKLVPTASPSKGSNSDPPMSEEKKVKLLGAVARRKPVFWKEIAKEVGDVTAAQCEAEWSQVIRTRP